MFQPRLGKFPGRRGTAHGRAGKLFARRRNRPGAPRDGSCACPDDPVAWGTPSIGVLGRSRAALGPFRRAEESSCDAEESARRKRSERIWSAGEQFMSGAHCEWSAGIRQWEEIRSGIQAATSKGGGRFTARFWREPVRERGAVRATNCRRHRVFPPRVSRKVFARVSPRCAR
jgi:hypothetical protein